MNIKGQGHSLTSVQGHSDSTFSNFFSLEIAKPIEAKFHVEPPWDGRTKVCSNGPDHTTNMAAMHIYGKTLKKIFFFGTKRPMTLKHGMHHQVAEYYQVCSNDDSGLTLTSFTARSNLVTYVCFFFFVKEKGKTMNFSEIVVVYDIKVGSCS